MPIKFRSILLVSAITATSSFVEAQISQNILEPNRVTVWNQAGVPGGIPLRSTLCATLNPGVTIDQINSAISNCPAGQVVFLNAGSYKLGAGTIQLQSNVTLRGAGANQTKLYFNGRGSCNGPASVICAQGSWVQGGYGSTPEFLTNWTGGYTKGSKVLNFASTTGLNVGALVTLEQLNDTADTGQVYVCNTGGVCGYTDGIGDIRPDRSQRQIVEVTAISGNQVTITHPLHMPNWRSSQSPSARWASGVVPSGIGLEDLSIDLMAANNTGGSESNIVYLGVKNSWIKGVRSVMADRSHVNLYQSKGITLRDNYLYGSFNGISTSYGVETFGASGDLLMENNLIQHSTAPIVINDGGANIVLGYNFTIDDYRAQPDYLMSASFHVHSPGVSHVLLEGNNGLAMVSDDWYGSTNFVTAFRNHFYGDIYNNPTKTTQTEIMQIAAYSRYYNFIGNVLGRSDYYTVYEPSGSIGCDITNIFCFGYSHATGGVEDALTKPTSMRWGNYDTVTGTSRFVASEVPSSLANYPNPVPLTNTLPTSLYLSAKPDWFGNTPFPAVGPDVNNGNISGYAGHANKNPARQCWEKSAVDLEYGTLNIRNYSRVNCFSSTATQVNLSAPINLRIN
ncbi:MAG: hypothetical protein ACXWRZ_16955 [Bdellovibrio sp.]